MLTTCQQCGAEFKGQGTQRKYCGMPCYRLGRRKSTTVACHQCGKPFDKIPSASNRYCSTDCSRAGLRDAKKALRTGEERSCEWCAASFYRYPGQIRRGWDRFCKRQCFAASKAAAQRETFVCESCGEQFELQLSEVKCRAKRGHPIRFCSRECTRTRVEKACLYCGKAFMAEAFALAEGKGIYCSIACARQSVIERAPLPERDPDHDAVVYAAAFIDADGCIYRMNARKRRWAVLITQAEVNNGRVFLEHMQSEWGFGTLRRSAAAGRMLGRYECSEQWSWHITAQRQVLYLLNLIGPHLRIKRVLARQAVQEIATFEADRKAAIEADPDHPAR